MVTHETLRQRRHASGCRQSKRKASNKAGNWEGAAIKVDGGVGGKGGVGGVGVGGGEERGEKKKERVRAAAGVVAALDLNRDIACPAPHNRQFLYFPLEPPPAPYSSECQSCR